MLISDLGNYTSALNQVDISKPVYLTRNSYGSYVITDIDDHDPAAARDDFVREIGLGLASMKNEPMVSLEEIAKKYDVALRK